MQNSAKPKPPKQKSEAEELYYANRNKWIEAVFRDTEITHADFRVLYFLARRSGYEHQGCFWSVPKIAAECQCSTKSVSVATTRAAEAGFLKVVNNPGRKNFYAPLFFWL